MDMKAGVERRTQAKATNGVGGFGGVGGVGGFSDFGGVCGLR